MALKSYKDQVEKVKEMVDNEENSGGYNSEDKWKPTIVGDRQTKYVVRLLPRMETETGQPWFEKRMHYIDLDNNERIIEPCPTTIEEDCPFCDEARKLFDTGNPFDEEKALNLWRKKRYVANILVREDGREDGENEGEVFLWEFGTTIYDIMKAAISDDGLIFWDPWDGADLRISVQPKKDWINYDGSNFERDNSPISESDEEAEEIVDECYNLTKRFEDAFKSYDELKEIMEEKMVLTEEDTEVIETKTDLDDLDEEDDEDIEEDLDFIEEELEDDDDIEVEDGEDEDLDDDFEDELEKELEEIDLDDI